MRESLQGSQARGEKVHTKIRWTFVPAKVKKQTKKMRIESFNSLHFGLFTYLFIHFMKRTKRFDPTNRSKSGVKSSKELNNRYVFVGVYITVLLHINLWTAVLGTHLSSSATWRKNIRAGRWKTQLLALKSALGNSKLNGIENKLLSYLDVIGLINEFHLPLAAPKWGDLGISTRDERRNLLYPFWTRLGPLQDPCRIPLKSGLLVIRA